MAIRQDNVIARVSQLDIATLRDPVAAQSTLVADLANRHHDMMAGWGRPPQTRGCYLRVTGSQSFTVGLRVPPNVTLMDIDVLMWGVGTLTITTAADATGVALRSLTTFSEESAEWIRTGGPIPSAQGAGSGRAFGVAAQSWDFQNIDMTWAFTSVTTECGVLAVVYRPVNQMRV